MASQSVTIELEGASRQRLEAYLAKVSSGLASMGGFFDAVEMYMIGSLTQNFEQEGRPQKWQPLSDVTIEMKGSDRILQDKGHLKASVNASNAERAKLSLTLWAGEKHGVFHQDPDTDPMDQFGMVNKRGMPFRPFIMFQDKDIDEIEKILERFVDDVMG